MRTFKSLTVSFSFFLTIGVAASAYAESNNSYRPEPPNRSTGHAADRGAGRNVEGASPQGPSSRAEVFTEPEYRSTIDRLEDEPSQPVPDSHHPASPIAPQPPPGVKRRDPI